MHHHRIARTGAVGRRSRASLAAAPAACGPRQRALERRQPGPLPLKAGESPTGQKLMRQAARRHAHRLRPRGLRSLRPGAGLLRRGLRRDLRDRSGRSTPIRRTRERARPRPGGGVRRSITDGGKTLTVTIKPQTSTSARRSTAKWSPADVTYAIERGANPNVANPYFHSYFGDIVGAEKAAGGPITGIQTPNARRSSST